MTPKSNIEKLVWNLKVINDDLTFLKKTGEEVTLEDYPFLTGLANKSLISKDGQFNVPHVERVEENHVMVSKFNNEIHFFLPNGYVKVPVMKEHLSDNLFTEDYRQQLNTAIGVEL